MTPRQRTLVNLAGPFANFVLAIVLLGATRLFFDHGHAVFWSGVAFLAFLQITALVLNLLPIPGLDGYAALEPHLSPSTRRAREPVRQWGFMILLVVLLLSEPYLAQEGQEGGASLRLHLPMAGVAIPAGIAGSKQTVMNPTLLWNPTLLLTLLVFFVLQALIYVSCLLKLAEIRRQQVSASMKLKLLMEAERADANATRTAAPAATPQPVLSA